MTSLKKFNMLLSQWQGNVVLVDQQTASVTLHGLQKQGHQWQFSPTKLCNLPVRVDQAITCEVMEDSGLGIRVPFFLITHQLGASQLASGRTCTHELLVCNDTDGSGGNVESYSRFDVPKSCLPDDGTSYQILDGPTVVWSEGARIHLARSTAKNPHTIVQQSFSAQTQTFIGAAATSGTKFSVGCFWAFDWPQNETDASNTLLLFIRVLPEPAWNGDQEDMEVDTHTSVDTTRFWLCLQVAAVDDSPGLQITLLPDSLIPNDYGFIATSVALHRSFSVNDYSGEIFSKCQFVVGTSYQQVVVFENGSMLHCIPMQCTPRRIYTIEIGDGHFVLAAWDKNTDVCAVKISEKKHQKRGTWKDVSGLLVGDFAGIGHEQLLLIFDSFNSGTITKFSVTDLAQFTASSEMPQDAEATSQPCAESLVSALKALQVREKNGEAYLTNLEREMQEKSHLLKRSVTFLKSLGRLDDAAVNRVPKPDPTLVCLLPGNVGILQDQINPETACYPGLEVLQSWQRIVDGQWLVGIVAKNALECPVQGIGLSLVPVGSKMPQESGSCVISMEKGSTRSDLSSSVPPEAKRRKLSASDMSSSSDGDGAILLPGRKVCVVVKTALPVLLGGTVKAAVVCSWKKQSDVRCNWSCEVVELGSVVLSMEQVTDRSLQCSKDCLSMWKGERTLPYTDTDQGSFQDLACFLTARSFVQVVAKSTHTNLLRLPAILKARLPLPSHAVTTSITVREPPGTDQLTKRSSEIFDGVWLCVHFHDDVHSASINILYQNTSQLSFLLEAMRSVLPEDVSIEATSANYREELATCLKLLGRELNAKGASVEQKLQQLKGSSLQNYAKSDDTSELASQTNSAIINLLCA